MKIAIVTDAWDPQINGVVTTLNQTVDGLEARGHEVHVLHPGDFPGVYLPGYNREIKIAIPRGVGRRLSELDPDCIHIATEGTLGLGARHWCRRNRRDFSTSFHTKFAEYL